MNVYKYFLCILLIYQVSVCQIAFARTVYDNAPYNNRDESVAALSTHQKKRLLEDEAPLENEEREEEDIVADHSSSLYDSPRYRKHPSETYIKHAARTEDELYDSKVNLQKREFYGTGKNSKDASIEVILDPKAKKAVAVVENSPSGQATYDLTGWKNSKDEANNYDGYDTNQQQVVSLVYPADRAARRFPADVYEAKNVNSGYKGKQMEGERMEETHLRKRNTEQIVMHGLELSKRKAEENNKKAELETQKRKTESKESNACPPHNDPASLEAGTNTQNSKTNENNEEQSNVKRNVPSWTQDQISALTDSLARVRDHSGEVENLKNILYDMGLVEESVLPTKREAKADERRAQMNKENAKRDLQRDVEDEDMSKDELVMQKTDSQNNRNENWATIDNGAQEQIEKRDTEKENAEEEANEEVVDEATARNIPAAVSDLKQTEAKEDVVNDNDNSNMEPAENDENLTREKRQESDSDSENSSKTKEDAAKSEKADVAETEDKSSSSLTSADNDSKPETEVKRDSKQAYAKDKKNEEDDAAFEKRVESEIQAKIDAIKEKVKREIMRKEQNKRNRRDIITLPESENENLDPNLNPDEFVKSHVRTRRDAKTQAENEKPSVNKQEKRMAQSTDSLLTNNLRKKRANGMPEKQMVYRQFQTEQDGSDQETSDGEFDDNSYDGRMYVEKRQSPDDDFQYYEPQKREIDDYDNMDKSPYLRNYYPEQRRRRSYSDGYISDSAPFHGGGMVVSRKAALRNKNFNDREKRGNIYNERDDKSLETAEDTADNDFFGALPESYHGELTRYKRVKRNEAPNETLAA